MDYVRDRTVADLHVLVTTQGTGGGGMVEHVPFDDVEVAFADLLAVTVAIRIVDRIPRHQASGKLKRFIALPP